VRQSVFEQGPITPAAVSALELAMFGLVLIAYGRTVTEAFRREPAVALVVLFVFTQIYPAEAYLGEDVLAAWRTRSLGPLNDELLLVFGLPLFFLKEATLVYFLRPYSLVLTLGLGVPLTILYWSAVIHVCERGAASARSELARVLARIPVALHIHIGHQPAAAPAPQAPAPEPAPPGRRPPGARRRRRPREGSPGPVTAEGAPRSEGGDSNAGTADTPHERPLAKGRKAGRRAR
jgi:hypothetical protein